MQLLPLGQPADFTSLVMGLFSEDDEDEDPDAWKQGLTEAQIAEKMAMKAAFEDVFKAPLLLSQDYATFSGMAVLLRSGDFGPLFDEMAEYLKGFLSVGLLTNVTFRFEASAATSAVIPNIAQFYPEFHFDTITYSPTTECAVSEVPLSLQDAFIIKQQMESDDDDYDRCRLAAKSDKPSFALSRMMQMIKKGSRN